MATPRPSWIQFSLRSILWLMLCIAIGFAAYRRGFDDGFADGTNSRTHVGQSYAKVYYVKDLLLPVLANGKPAGLNNDALVRDIRANVLPKTWVETGGQAAIESFESNWSLVVLHDEDGHDKIAAYLKQRRDKNNRLAAGD